MREGLYRVAFHNVHGAGGGVMYMRGGKMRGGNSAFAFIGSYTEADDVMSVKVSTRLHTLDPDFKPLFGGDDVTIVLKGKAQGDTIDLEGAALHMPGVTFKAMLTMIEAD
ncbi:MAG: hypothetical protein ACTHM2_20085 [Afipia sp.]|jgi:hypothetical protein